MDKLINYVLYYDWVQSSLISAPANMVLWNNYISFVREIRGWNIKDIDFCPALWGNKSTSIEVYNNQVIIWYCPSMVKLISSCRSRLSIFNSLSDRTQIIKYGGISNNFGVRVKQSKIATHLFTRMLYSTPYVTS